MATSPSRPNSSRLEAPGTLRRILVANRGEIALRIIRAAHQLGLEAVVVFSEADRESLPVCHADGALPLGSSEPLNSYLDQEKILAAARACGAQGVHPGYGFLAENAGFARRVQAAGLIFIGPGPEAIEGMGDKIQSRRIMEAHGIPVVPGQSGVTRENLQASAAQLGFPLLLKASAGGGGRGIRLVRDQGELLGAFESAQGEAHTAFGDATIYMERFIPDPHHIEIQILADHHGNRIHLFERECSVQRRHQKVIEEAPSPFVTPSLREAMGATALKAAQAIGYQNAGTVEFLVDRDKNFYFLEMNTRLQVEHAVTEMTTGIDLVSWQIRIAAGGALGFKQTELKQQGHALEVRVCAEDPDNNYLPSAGRIAGLSLPGGPGVRLDSALFRGLEVSLYYDSMLARLIVHGHDRAQALARMRQALRELKVVGPKTNIALLARVLKQKEFVCGEYDTGILDRLQPEDTPEELLAAAVSAAVMVTHRQQRETSGEERSARPGLDPWKLLGRQRNLRKR